MCRESFGLLCFYDIYCCSVSTTFANLKTFPRLSIFTYGIIFSAKICFNELLFSWIYFCVCKLCHVLCGFIFTDDKNLIFNDCQLGIFLSNVLMLKKQRHRKITQVLKSLNAASCKSNRCMFKKCFYTSSKLKIHY